MDYPPLQASLRDMAAIVFRRKRSIVTIVAVAFVSAVVWLWFIRSSAYEVSAKVLVRMGREQGAPSTMLDQRGLIVGDRTVDVNSEVDLLHNRDIVSRVVDQLGLATPPELEPVPRSFLRRVRYEFKAAKQAVSEKLNEALIGLGVRRRLSPRDVAIEQLHGSMLVTPQKNSGVIVVRLFMPSREGSSRILNAFLDAYLDYRAEVFRDQTAVDFFTVQVDETKRHLDAVADSLGRFETRGGITAIQEQESALLHQISEGQIGLYSARIARQEAAARVQRLESEVASPEPNFAAIGAFRDDPYPQRLLSDLATLQREREQLRMNEFDTSLRLRSNGEQLELLAGYLASNLRADLAERQATYEARWRVVSSLEARLASLHSQKRGWEELRRSADVLEDSYVLYRKKLEEASANSALGRERISNVAVIQHATDPLRPVGMRKLVLLGLVLVFSAFLALTWVVVAEFFDHRVHSPEALALHLGVPVLASVPLYRRRGGPRPWAIAERRVPLGIRGPGPGQRSV